MPPARIVQLTDTHITRAGEQHFCGLDSSAMLRAVIDQIRRDPWQPEAILVTGDLSADGSESSYQRARSLLALLERPVFCIPGNHDDPATMAGALVSGAVQIARSAQVGAWKIVLLDSCLAGKDYGVLRDSELKALQGALSEPDDRPILIALHHGPEPNCAMQSCQLINKAEFLSLIRQYDSVKGVIAGHLHCAREHAGDGPLLLTTPSTCVQCIHPTDTPDDLDAPFLKYHQVQPGISAYRRLELGADGRIATELIWVEVPS
jgi:Icc protein